MFSVYGMVYYYNIGAKMNKFFLFLLLLTFTINLCSCAVRFHHHHSPPPILDVPIIHDDEDLKVQLKEEQDDTATYHDLDKIFRDSGCLTSDYTYWKPSKEFVLDVLYPYYKKFLDDQ